MDTGEVFAVVASGAAVATSLGSMAVALTALLRDRAHLKIETNFGILTPSFEDVVQLNVINDGRHTEVVSSVGFSTTAGKQLIFIRPENFPNGQLPWRLEPNESNLAVMLRNAMRQQLAEEVQIGRITKVFARTQSGRLYEARVRSAIVDDICGKPG